MYIQLSGFNATHTHTHTQICISGQWVCRKGSSNDEGFQGRFETIDRGRMTDKNRELVPNSWDLVWKIANFVLMCRIWQTFLVSGYHCWILNCLVCCCCPPPPPPIKLDNCFCISLHQTLQDDRRGDRVFHDLRKTWVAMTTAWW